MDAEVLKSLIEIAENDLQLIRGSLLVSVHSDAAAGDFGIALRKLHALKERSATFGLEALERLSGDVEESIERITRSGRTPGDREVYLALDHVAKIEELLVRMKLDADGTEFDVGSFVDESFKTFEPSERKIIAAPLPVPAQPPELFDRFEIDDELLEIFGIEAAELLEAIANNIDALRIDRQNKDALWDIQRRLHTFKGAAGVAGQQRASALAHRAEDAIGNFGETGSGDDAILDLLSDVTELLSDLTKDPFSIALAAKCLDIEKKFEILAGDESSPHPVGKHADHTDVLHQSAPPAVSVPRKETRATVRVSLERLDELAVIMQRLIASRTVIEQRFSDLNRTVQEVRDLSRSLTPVNSDVVTDTADPLRRLRSVSDDVDLAVSDHRRVFSEMQQKLRSLRLVVFGMLAPRLDRAVRITCEDEGKLAEIVWENGEMELDTGLLDSLVEPVLHLLRNAVVHGIELPETRRLLNKPETGRITLNIASEETHIVLRVSDDGGGVDLEALKRKAIENNLIDPAGASKLTEPAILELMFLPGLTTSNNLNINAGRGVGMSIVRESVENRSGTVTVTTRPHHGTTFELRVPDPLSLSRVLAVGIGEDQLGLPLSSVTRVTEVSPQRKAEAFSSGILELGDIEHRFVDLSAMLENDACPASGDEFTPVVVIDNKGDKLAAAADQILRSEEVSIRRLGPFFDCGGRYLGASIFSNGHVVPILDPAKISSTCGTLPADVENDLLEIGQPAPWSPNIFLVDDSPSIRVMTTQMIRNLGFAVQTAVDGAEALYELQRMEHLPDVILSDVEMPRMDGYELLAELKNDARLRDIPVIMITSRFGSEYKEKALRQGAAEYLIKPVDEALLLQAIRSLSIAAGRSCK
jgi:chemosensory pili system protein ChpA (sensor histidine kinase/response regulator)